jgi:hypothetical protein
MQALLKNASKNSRLVTKGFGDEDDMPKDTIQLKHIDVNCKESKFQMTPLIIASVQGQKDIVSILLTHNAKIQIRDVKG